MAIYKIIGQQLIHHTHSLALQQIGSAHYRIGDQWFRVVPLGELPGSHRYAEGYKRTDPVIRRHAFLFPSFSAFPLRTLLSQWSDEEGLGDNTVLTAPIGHDDPRYGRLLTDDIGEDLSIAIGYRTDQGDLNAAILTDYRYVIVSGFRLNETVAAHVWVGYGNIVLRTTEAPAADRSQPVAQRFPKSIPLWRRVLRHFELETDVIDRGRVIG
ncbi:unnamed protein product [Vitrella brassicaformis CCMP3155]|uniref:Uncharacterized protein n=1 Tax=Vitrella brassicaformis (strain CCMP3155) TaxID=1169540 RepID=A0A0G4F6Z2_VITBC|nr:unnamed protein product [Vitrella brassicaformis CCMP3155]|eukprot:CEM07783.1 unnamed protein product [Vitrella brassicaformis CCMP3155]